MGRPRKYRKVCRKPSCTRFAPLYFGGNENDTQDVVMSVDEYEVVRLIDLNNMTQEECARQMNIARTTVQKMYIDARYKLAKFIVEGTSLLIDGGEVQFCEHEQCKGKMGKHCRCMDK